MILKNLLLSSAALLVTGLSASAQTFVPPNMDFELGTTANWTFYRGTVASGHIFALSSTAPVAGLHTLTSGAGTDAYGGFSVVSSGLYSLKLAHDTIDNNADAASYNIAVPSGGSYSLIYEYAAVLEDPGHPPGNQPAMVISAVDSNTGTALPGTLTISANDPGFVASAVTPFPKYKPWTTGSFDLSGYGGHTVIVKFTAAACTDGGHFGYGYIDVTGCFESSAPESCTTMASLGAPAGYQTYKWTDATTYSASYGTTAVVSVTAPTVTTTYAVILTPYSGHGTIDTFNTTQVLTPPASITGVTSVTASHITTLSDATIGGTWTSSNTAIATVGPSTGIVTGVTAGTATIMYSMGGACNTLTTVTVTAVPTATSIYSTGGGDIYSFPNPTSGAMEIQWANQQTGPTELTITDMAGRVLSKSVLNMDVPSGKTQINMGGFSDGMYLMTIRSTSINYCSRVVVQK